MLNSYVPNSRWPLAAVCVVCVFVMCMYEGMMSVECVVEGVTVCDMCGCEGVTVHGEQCVCDSVMHVYEASGAALSVALGPHGGHTWWFLADPGQRLMESTQQGDRQPAPFLLAASHCLKFQNQKKDLLSSLISIPPCWTKMDPPCVLVFSVATQHC